MLGRAYTGKVIFKICEKYKEISKKFYIVLSLFLFAVFPSGIVIASYITTSLLFNVRSFTVLTGSMEPQISSGQYGIYQASNRLSSWRYYHL